MHNRPLKVIGGNFGGTHRAILACRSMAEFTRATRIERGYARQTGNQEEIALAMSKPGTMFVRAYAGWHGNPWLEHRRYDEDKS